MAGGKRISEYFKVSNGHNRLSACLISESLCLVVMLHFRLSSSLLPVQRLMPFLLVCRFTQPINLTSQALNCNGVCVLLNFISVHKPA